MYYISGDLMIRYLSENKWWRVIFTGRTQNLQQLSSTGFLLDRSVVWIDDGWHPSIGGPDKSRTGWGLYIC